MNHSGNGHKRPHLPWGFSMYRCTYKDEKAWDRMLRLIHEKVQTSFELEDSRAPEAADLLPYHQLIINDDPKKFDGATSHEVRDHFNIWVAEQLPLVSSSPRYSLKTVREDWPYHQPGPEYSFGARYNFALFVDDICLESLDHMDWPVVKITSKQWGNLDPEERNYEVYPGWDDGTTEMGEEDVGWMYMDVGEYVKLYGKLEYAHLCAWDNSYVRPPQMDSCWGDESRQPGFWRKQISFRLCGLIHLDHLPYSFHLGELK